MATYQNYVMAQSLEEAYALNQKKSSVIVAGNMWLRMCGLRRQTAIDLSGLGLDRVEETEDALRYRLTAGEYETLLEQLAQAGIVPETPGEAGDTVVVEVLKD